MSARGKRRICLVDTCEVTCSGFRSSCPSDFKLDIFDDVLPCTNQILDMSYDLLIADVRLLDIDGTDHLTAIRKQRPLLPIIGMGQSMDIPSIVRLMKKGLSDFIEKPFDFSSLFTKIQKSLNIMDGLNPLVHLTPCEKKIFYHVMKGKSNKEMAMSMQKSIRTIEDHRANLMKKVGASNVVDLIKFGVGYWKSYL